MNSNLRIFIFLLYFFLQTAYGRRGFEIILDSITCSSNSKYISWYNCTLSKSMRQGSLSLVFQMNFETSKSLAYSLKIDAVRSNNDHFTLINVKNGDACTFLDGKFDGALLNIYRESLAEAGELPKCPIPKNFLWRFQNITVNPEKFPPYLPETKFTVDLQVDQDNEMIIKLTVEGTVMQKRSINKFG